MTDTDPSLHPAESLLSRAHSPQTAKTIFTDRIRYKPLLLRAATSSETASGPGPSNLNTNTSDKDARARRQRIRDSKRLRQASKKPHPLSAKRKRELRVYDIPRDQRRYEIYKPLHEMWCRYMRGILGLGDDEALEQPETQKQPRKPTQYITPASSGPVLTGADYHGANLKVVRSRCVSRVGVSGIVLRDTKFVFQIITVRNEVKTLPKENSVFRFEVPRVNHVETPDVGVSEAETTEQNPPLVFEIHGSQFETRPQDRANKKFKPHFDVDL